ncbi:hypothetical protein HN51_039808 [Arachis hypogaea]
MESSSHKFALMTTAYVVDNTMKPLKDASNAEKPLSPYDHGASHINPTKVLDPSLVYDIKPQDYLDFLCTQNLTPNQLGVFHKYANRSCAHSLASPELIQEARRSRTAVCQGDSWRGDTMGKADERIRAPEDDADG